MGITLDTWDDQDEIEDQGEVWLESELEGLPEQERARQLADFERYVLLQHIEERLAELERIKALRAARKGKA